MVAKLHFIPALMVGAALLFTPRTADTAPRAPSIDNLKGKYQGIYTPDGGSQGVMRLTISQDKRKRDTVLRSIKASAKFGNKAYNMTGFFDPDIDQLRLTAIIGRRPPNVTLVTFTADVDESGTEINGGYTITTPTSTVGGTVSVSR
jgi:hypothetical protein